MTVFVSIPYIHIYTHTQRHALKVMPLIYFHRNYNIQRTITGLSKASFLLKKNPPKKTNYFSIVTTIHHVSFISNVLVKVRFDMESFYSVCVCVVGGTQMKTHDVN